MLVHHLRRWPNIKPTLVQYIVFAGKGVNRTQTMISQTKAFEVFILKEYIYFVFLWINCPLTFLEISCINET